MVKIDPLDSLGLASRTILQQCQRVVCRMIANTRSGVQGKETLWDDCGHDATAQMLHQLMPGGYERANLAVWLWTVYMEEDYMIGKV